MPDPYNLYAVEVLKFPAGWRWFSLNSSTTGRKKVPEGFARIEGAVSPTGKWKDRDPTTELMFVCRLCEVRQWFKRWAALMHGKCDVCWGTGREWFGWGKDTGHRYKQCTTCGGSGKPSDAIEATPSETRTS